MSDEEVETSTSFGGRIKHAWDAFIDRDQKKGADIFGPTPFEGFSTASYAIRPLDTRMRIFNDKSIIGSIFNTVSNDAASIPIQHVRLDENDNYVEDINSGLDECLNIQANIDQEGRTFRHDAVLSLLEEGVIAIVPVVTTLNPIRTGGFDVRQLRVGTINTWYPEHVRVNLYNQRTGNHEDVTLPKNMVAIVENPFFSIMNQPNSTLKRLVYKLSLIDMLDEQNSSGKLDIIIQLPYVVKSETRRNQAEQRRKDIEMQLTGSKYGIAYTDGTERITQLNRPAENSLREQVADLTKMLYAQLGITEEIMNGTAEPAVMLNYYNRTIDPILTAITEAMRAKFLTKTARSQGQSIMFLRDPFKLVPVEMWAEIADKFTRNAVLSPNEIRPKIGFKPVPDPAANELINRNMPVDKTNNVSPDSSPENSEDGQEGTLQDEV